MVHSMRLVTLCFLVSCTTFLADAVELTEETGQKWGLIIGINHYEDPYLNSLKYAARDAKAMYELLTDPGLGGLDRDKMYLLVSDGEKKPTRSAILADLHLLTDAITPEDTVIFHYSGHGMTEAGENYLLPADATSIAMVDTAISISKIFETLGKAKTQVIFLDACHSGQRVGKSGSGRMSKAWEDAVFTETEGRVVLASCDIDESSYEDEDLGHGVFTYYLLEGLKGWADSPTVGVIPDGRVTASEVNRYVVGMVKERSRRMGRRQNPRISGNMIGEIPLISTGKGVIVDPPRPPKPTRLSPDGSFQPPDAHQKHRVMILVTNKHQREIIEAAEITQKLIQAGFSVVDVEHLQALQASDYGRRLLWGDIEAVSLVALQVGATVLVKGQMTVECRDARIGGNDFVSCDGWLDLTVVQSDTAEILTAQTFEGKGVDLAEGPAVVKAVRAAMENIDETFIQEILGQGRPLGNSEDSTPGESVITLKISDVTFTHLTTLMEVIPKQVDVIQLELRNFSGDAQTAEVIVTVNRSPEQFAKDLVETEFSDFMFEVSALNGVVVEVRLEAR